MKKQKVLNFTDYNTTVVNEQIRIANEDGWNVIQISSYGLVAPKDRGSVGVMTLLLEKED